MTKEEFKTAKAAAKIAQEQALLDDQYYEEFIRRDKALTVAQLIEQLKLMPPEAPVQTEGCDCYGPAAHVCLVDDMVEILRKRPE
jgi:hypothetical protein